MSKKLVQINVTCNGSTGRIMEQIQKEAEKNGYEAYSFYGRGKPSNKNCFKIGNKLDLYWNVFLTRLFNKHAHGSKRATKYLVKRIRKINPDIIQLHNIHGYYLNMEILFKYLKESNKKIIWTLHDCWAFTGHCAYFSYPKECNKWQVACENCPRVKSYPKSFFIDSSQEEFLLKKELFTGIKNMTIITPSNWLAELVRKSFLKEYDIKVINNGVDLNIFKPTNTINVREKYNIGEDKKIVLGVASVWDKRKGLDDFIELSRQLTKDYVIIIVGLNKKQIKLLPSNIIGMERTENLEELANLYTQADIFANPTYEDNFPTTNLEALACGTPVLTYDTGGSGEIIGKQCGKVISRGNIQQLKEDIENNKLEAGACVRRAERYRNSIKYKEYIELYEKVLGD